MKRGIYPGIAALVMVAFVAVLFAVDNAMQTWTGQGPRNNTVEFKITSPTVGTAADFVPGTDNTNSLGTSSLRWDDVQTNDLTVADDLTVTDDAAVSGKLTVTESVITSPATVQSVQWSTNTITPSAEFVLIGSTGAITMRGTPAITTTTATNGQHLVLLSTAATVTLQDNETVAGTLVEVNSTTVAISTSVPREFRYYGGTWYLIQ